MGAKLRVDVLAWLAVLLSVVATNGAYLISASQGFVPWCFPYLEGCTSISRAARQGDAIFLFKGLMIPYSLVLMLFWWRTARWLGELAPPRRRTGVALIAFGLVAGLAALLYVAALGVEGEQYQVIRRYGINLMFGFTLLGELVLTAALAAEASVPQELRRRMVGLCLVMLLIGLASIPLQFLIGSRSATLFAIEWTYALLMVAYLPLVGAAWRRTRRTDYPAGDDHA